MLPVIEAFTEDIKKVNTLLQLATLTRNILQKLTIKDIQVVTLPDSYFKFKFVTEDGSTIETNSVFIGESISIDDALSAVSTNPVQNKVITNAINAINESITTLTGRVDGHDTDIQAIQLVLNKLAEIKDAQNRNRFVEGAINLQAYSGVSFKYSRWSLSGSHLQIAIAAEVDAGSTIPTNSLIGTVTNLPTWVMEKIVPVNPTGVSSGYVSAVNSPISLTGYNLSGTNAQSYAYKVSNGELDIYCWGVNANTEKQYFRIEFDFIIDTL